MLNTDFVFVVCFGGADQEEEEEETPAAYCEESIRYRGKNIPSRSFAMLQKMTGEDPSARKLLSPPTIQLSSLQFDSIQFKLSLIVVLTHGCRRMFAKWQHTLAVQSNLFITTVLTRMESGL